MDVNERPWGGMIESPVDVQQWSVSGHEILRA